MVGVSMGQEASCLSLKQGMGHAVLETCDCRDLAHPLETKEESVHETNQFSTLANNTKQH
jgi:hypothetical protein